MCEFSYKKGIGQVNSFLFTYCIRPYIKQRETNKSRVRRGMGSQSVNYSQLFYCTSAVCVESYKYSSLCIYRICCIYCIPVAIPFISTSSVSLRCAMLCCAKRVLFDSIGNPSLTLTCRHPRFRHHVSLEFNVRHPTLIQSIRQKKKKRSPNKKQYKQQAKLNDIVVSEFSYPHSVNSALYSIQSCFLDIQHVH